MTWLSPAEEQDIILAQLDRAITGNAVQCHTVLFGREAARACAVTTDEDVVDNVFALRKLGSNVLLAKRKRL